jgi:hypothetical protein
MAQVIYNEQDDSPIVSAALSIERDGYMRLQYRIATGQVVASLGTFYEGIVRDDYEATVKRYPGMTSHRQVDFRKKRSKVQWYQETTKEGE